VSSERYRWRLLCLRRAHAMSLPQLVGFRCAICGKTISSIADGEFCSECSNPVHLRCRREIQDATRCQRCGADPESHLAQEVRAALLQNLKAGNRQLVCPNCRSTKGFRPFRRDEGPSPPFAPFFVYFLSGILLYLLHDASPGGQVQCCACEYVFWPRSRFREIGCITAIILALAGVIAWMIKQSSTAIRF
jgi:hypothetical protein